LKRSFGSRVQSSVAKVACIGRFKEGFRELLLPPPRDFSNFHSNPKSIIDQNPRTATKNLTNTREAIEILVNRELAQTHPRKNDLQLHSHFSVRSSSLIKIFTPILKVASTRPLVSENFSRPAARLQIPNELISDHKFSQQPFSSSSIPLLMDLVLTDY
jgi:hypothetical protein